MFRGRLMVVLHMPAPVFDGLGHATRPPAAARIANGELRMAKDGLLQAAFRYS